MNRLFLAVVALVGLWAAACSNGGTVVTPPPPTGPFSVSSLNGQFAFTTNGEVATTTSIPTSFARVGSFIADGMGHITGGVEDANTLTVGITGPAMITGGTYTVNPNGHGTLSVTVNGASLMFSITLTSTDQGFLVDLTSNANQASTGSGNFFKQDPSKFLPSGFNGSYAFDFTGFYPDGNDNPTSIIGQLISNSGGVLSPSVEDVNEAGLTSSLVGISGNYSADSLNPGASLTSFGRGVAQINDGGSNPAFVFYIVDGTRVRFLSSSAAGLLLGDAVAQANVPTQASSFNSGFVFALGGADVSAGGTPLSRLGRFTANGATVTAALVDTNDAGKNVQTNSITSGTITIDPAGSGRGTLTFKDPNQSAAYEFVFYLSTPSSGVIQDVAGTNFVSGNTSGFVSDGSLNAQTAGPFSGSNVSGPFGFNWSGQSIQTSSKVEDEEDIIGQVGVSSLSLTGVADINEFSGGVIPNAVASGTLTLAGDGTGGDGKRSAMTVTLKSTSSTNINFVPYVVSPGLILFASTDNNRVVIGTLQSQPTTLP